MRTKRLAFLLVTTVVSAPIVWGQEEDCAKARDARLIAAVRAAAVKGTRPEKVEEVVGSAATINTIRRDDEDVFGKAKFNPDPDQKPEMPKRNTFRWVVYWVRPVEGINPKIVGICWPKDGKTVVFFGEVLAPP